MIKICHITTDSNLGGTEKTISILLEKLPTSKFKQSLIILKQCEYLNTFANNLNIPNIALNLSIIKIFNIVKIIIFLIKFKPDVIISYLYHSNIIARFIGFIFKIKVICGQRNIDLWRNRWHVLLDRYTHRFCNVIISNSFAAKKRLIEIEKIPEDKIKVIYNGVEIPKPINNDQINQIRLNYGFKENDIIFLCPASLTIKKGHANLIHAFEKIIKSYQNVYLILAGEGSEKKNIIQLINNLNLNKNIILTGLVHPIYPIMQISDVIILTSQYEGFPNVILEALACKKTIITTNTGGINEIISHGVNGLIIEQNIPEKIFEMIEFYLNNHSNLKELNDEWFCKIKTDFSIEVMIEKYEKLILEIV